MEQLHPPGPPPWPASTSATPGVLRLGDPGDVVVMIPYLLGFDPVDSLVLVALEGPRRRVGPCCRIDLVDGGDPAEVRQQVDFLLGLVARHGFGPVLLVAYTGDALRAEAVLRPLLAGLARVGVEVLDAVRADGHRWWSLTCTSSCCGPAGTPYDPTSARVAAEAVVAGLSRAPDRDALRAQFEPVPTSRRALAAALRSARRRRGRGEVDVPALVGRLLPLARTPAGHDLTRLPGPDLDAAADLLLAVQSLPLRDEAWVLMRRGDAADHFTLWRALMQAAPDALMAPPGSLTAFAAWLSGRGVLATHAAERVRRVSPDYRLADLVLQLCDRGVDPASWTASYEGVTATGIPPVPEP